MNCKISVIIPCYNAEKYLDRCIKSVINQTYRNLELICIDDCSTDSTNSILHSYKSLDSRVKVYKNNHNIGLSATRNRGLKYCTGKYVFFLDSDDSITNDAFEQLSNFSKDKNLDIVLFNATQIENEKNFILKRQYTFDKIITGKEVLCLAYNSNNLDFYPAWVNLYKLSFLRKNKITFFENIYHEDILYTFIIFFKAKKVGLINKEFYNYYKNPNTITTMKINSHHIESLVVVYAEIYKFLNKCKNHDFLKVISMYLFNVFKHLCDKIKNSDINIYEVKISESFDKYVPFFLFLRPMIASQNLGRSNYLLDEKDILSLKIYSNIVVYGAGIWARRVLVGLGEKNIEDFVVAVTDNANAGKLLGNKIHQLNLLDVDYEDTIVILAVGKKYKDEMREYAESLGFKHFLELRY